MARPDATPLLALAGVQCAALVRDYAATLQWECRANPAALGVIDRIVSVMDYHRTACVYTALLADMALEERLPA